MLHLQDLPNPKSQVSRIATSTSPRGSDGMWTPSGSWSYSPVIPSSALPLTPVGSEGDLTALDCESPAGRSRAGSFSPQMSLLGEASGLRFHFSTEASIDVCSPRTTGDADDAQGPRSPHVSTPEGDCSDTFIFPVFSPVAKSFSEAEEDSAV
jgi:hypothetical protein